MKEIYLDESEEKLTVDEIQSFEKKIGKIFPNDFKKFLLKSNGGYPRYVLLTKRARLRSIAERAL